MARNCRAALVGALLARIAILAAAPPSSLESVLWGGAHGDASCTSGGASAFPAPRGGVLAATLNSSALAASSNVVVLGDGVIIGASAEAGAPALQALGGASWRLALGFPPSASAPLAITALRACDATTVLALVTPLESGVGPPVHDWYCLAAADVGASPPVVLWTRNASSAYRPAGPPGAVFATCAARVVAVLTPSGDVTTLDTASGALRAHATGVAVGAGAPCALTTDARVLACPSGASSAGGAMALELLNDGGPALAWTPASMGWSLGDGGAGAPPLYDAPSDTFLFSNFTAVVAATSRGALRWEAPLPPGTLVSSTLLAALPRPPNVPQVAVFAANLQGGAAELGTVWALDMRSGARLATGTLPNGVQLTDALVVDATGSNCLVSGWDITLSASAAFLLHFDALRGALVLAGASPWRAAPSEGDIFPALALAGDETLLVQWGAALSRIEPAHPRPPCAWSAALPAQYVAHCADDGCMPHAALAVAQAACAASLTCGGLTSDPATGSWQLRAGSTAAPSADGETAFLITNAALCHAP